MKIPRLEHLQWLRSTRDFVEAAAKRGAGSTKELRARIAEQHVEIKDVVFSVGGSGVPCLTIELEDGSVWICYAQLEAEQVHR